MKRKLYKAGKAGFLIILFGILFSYAMFQGGFVSWFLFYSFLPFLIYMGGLLFYPLDDWTGARTLSSGLIESGEAVEIEIELRRTIPFPLYFMKVKESYPETLHLEVRSGEGVVTGDREEKVVERMIFPWFRRTVRFHYRLDHLPRGSHQLGEMYIRTGDFFGFVKKEAAINAGGRFTVYPASRNVSLSLGTKGFGQGKSAAANVKERHSNMVAGLREYAPGDRISWVDWKATARKNKMMTKEFEQEKSSESVLVLSTLSSPGNTAEFEGAVEFAYSLMLKLTRRETRQLSFLSLGRAGKYVASIHSRRQQEMIRYHLAEVSPDETGNFEEEMAKGHGRLSAQATLMIISTDLDDSIKNSLLRLSPSGRNVVLFVIMFHKEWDFTKQKHVRELKEYGVRVQVLTEKAWKRPEFEVEV
ncbi:hypothetical protein AAV35_010735 [Salimicrobium jeotgali]|uniref:DUF58 domain-containing protein n=1 Tax=Salimicrobium jeotgali TaxID=1230341 RepID=K2FN92_9BACI|nr:DUF58 domain-containing protein [Salimicrobium jeotgali]AKG05213.1 hypothetical protein AAV35_010735 [Salimicrobium jeotgali]EKE32406.1 hypothetical protein MJ3_03187 [Salimicrobium jeotgali]MBM7695615.1 uncharacterized protein (DUF58 family) [Salimicrobium jeotgali]